MKNITKLETSCVEWDGRQDKDGYGLISWKGRTRRAHRVRFCQDAGLDLEQIDGLIVMHRCDNPPCVRPSHLILATQLDNMRDRKAKGRANLPSGESHWNVKLTDEDVRQICELYASGMFSQQVIANRFDINQSRVSRIVRGLTRQSTQRGG